jgi:hypothetical protein
MAREKEREGVTRKKLRSSFIDHMEGNEGIFKE